MSARRAAPVLGAILLAWVPYRAFFSSEVPVGRDLLYYFYPLKAHLVEGLLRGELPWVDRFRWGGVPLLGGPSAAAFDPANVLFLALPLGLAMKAWILLHLALLVSGFAAFGRRLGLGGGSAAVAGLASALTGVTVSLAPFPAALSALSILPWFAAYVFDLVQKPSLRAAARVAALAALIVLASVPEFVLFAAAVALAVLASAPPEPDAPAPRRRALAFLAGAAILSAALAAVALLPGAAATVRSIRGPGGGMGTAAAALQPLAPVRLREFLGDGLVADWTRVAAAPGVPDYPYLPSLTPGRVVWPLVLLGLASGGAGRVAAVLLAGAGTLLALGDATPVFGLASNVVPFLSSIRYPEKHALLAGFGLAWLAALGLRRLETALSPPARRAILPLVALAVLADREGVARRLSPTGDGTVLTRPPETLASLPRPGGDAPPPRIFPRDLYAPVPVYARDDVAAANETARNALVPAYASLFGAGYVFEKDYDLSLPVESFEWTRLLARAVPTASPLPLHVVRAAGASAILATERGADGRFRPRLRRIGDAVPPFRFASRVVASDDARAVFARFLEDGVPPDVGYVDTALPGLPEVPGAGRVLSVSDRPSGLSLDVEVVGESEGFLMLWRLREAVEDAAIDGRRVTAAPMAFGFAGLRVPPGRHLVTLRPDTRWVKIGALVSVAAILLALALARRGDARSAAA